MESSVHSAGKHIKRHPRERLDRMKRAPTSQLGPMVRVRQQRESPPPVDVPAAVRGELRAMGATTSIQPGDSVAVTLGSRGITDIAPAAKAIVDQLLELDAKPFVVPAMGSHGGATAAGQTGVLATLGITEQSLGVPIDANMETVEVGVSDLGVPLVTARAALDADHVILCNRIKPHTHFSGSVQSGLVKMLVIGLGKQEGAELHHQTARDLDWSQVIQSVVPPLIEKVPILGGIGLVEGPNGSTVRVAGLPAGEFLTGEPALMAEASAYMHRLPFRQIDLLVIDWLGKNISGTGIDTNVVGRKRVRHGIDPDADITITAIAARALTPETEGNAIGIGTATFCRSQIIRQMDIAKTRLNALTAMDPEAALLPLDYESDAAMLDAALPIVGRRTPSEARLVWIADTLHIHELICAAALTGEVHDHPDLEIVSDPFHIEFDADGNVPANFV